MDARLPNTSQQYVTLAEAAALLGVSKATLRNWDRAGKLAAIRHPLNSYRLYDIAEVKQLQAQLGLFAEPESALPPSASGFDTRPVRRLIAKLHAILRNTDSQSNIISRFDEITKLLFAKVIADRGKAAGRSSPFDAQSENTNTTPIRDAYRQLADQYREFIPQRFAAIHMSDRAILECVSALRNFDYDAAQFDVKGLAYEEIIRNTFDKGDHQQFFTPPQIVDFIVAMAGPFLHGDVCDPASGTGGFLVGVARQGLAYTSLTSIEIDERLSWISGMNLLLHEGRSAHTLYLPNGGTLGPDAKPYFGSFDTILTNPPFGSDFTDRAALEDLTLGASRTSRRRGILFIERCHSLLRDNGTLAIILDEGVLNLNHAIDVRRYITKNFDLRAVVSLPETAFMPYASVNASILILSKRSATDNNSAVFLARAEKVGRKINGDDDIHYNRGGTSHLNSDLPTILMAWHEYCTSHKLPDGPDIYVADVAGNLAINDNGHRLDFQYHHPSRRISQELLAHSAYPIKRLGDICTERNSTIIPSKELADTVIAYTGLANIEAQTGIAEQVATPANALKSAVKVYQRGDIVFAKMRPNLRKVALMDVGEWGYVSPECVVLTVKKIAKGEPILDPLILSVLLRSDFVFGQIMHLVAGIGRPRISVKELREVQIPVPPKAVQERIKADYLHRRAEAERLKIAAEAMLEQAETVRMDSTRLLASDVLSAPE
jgi:predicted RNA methylase